MVLTEDKRNEVETCFKSIYKANSAIEELKENEKVYSDSIKETFKSLAEILELDPRNSNDIKAIKEAYFEYVQSIDNPAKLDIKNEILLMLKNFDLLGLESIKD